MVIQDDLARLMKFPKEVLADYFLQRHLFSIDWRYLEFQTVLLQQRQLLTKVDAIHQRQAVKGIPTSEWFRLQEESDRIFKRLSRMSKKLDKLQGIEGGD